MPRGKTKGRVVIQIDANNLYQRKFLLNTPGHRTGLMGWL
jgi:hypothetical protein